MDSTPKKYKVDKNLEEWIKDRDPSDFPKSHFPYSEMYTSTKNHLAKIHDEVERGALFHDIEELLKEGTLQVGQISYLNQHGQEHVSQVIDRATCFLGTQACELTAYEGYLLLMAIQFHDVGNIFGRKNHEKKCHLIMKDIGPHAGIDTVEQRAIIKIAAVHGGLCEEDKDTISSLAEHVDLLGQNDVRMRFLAAVLRFADELADDKSRASRYLLEKKDIPTSSIIYHHYSSCLHSVILKKDAIKLAFEVDECLAAEPFDKCGVKVFIIDEIYSRTVKMFYEQLYCLRFMRNFVDERPVRVQVQFFNDDDVLDDVVKIQYSLEEKGYPLYSGDSIYEICPELKKWSGDNLKKILNDRKESIK